MKDNVKNYNNEYKNSSDVVEVLAPAGSLDICKVVINAGADAVYLGGDMFGARAYAGNLSQEEMFEAIDYAHSFNRKIYLAVNTLLKQNEIDKLLIDYLKPFYEYGLDAVIVQDLGVMRLLLKHFPDMDIHASTQMTQTGEYGAGLLYEAGAKRVVTSREMTLKELAKLHKAYPDMEIESFVHGAMCYCYSGQCLMSSFNGGRSGNRGRCAQPCRLPYKVYANDELVSSAKESYALSPKDMCALKILPDIIDAGVYSLKIEGRMKNVTYAAFVTSIYRKYVDMYLAKGRKGYHVTDEDIDYLCDIYNRGAFTTGFYNSEKGHEMMALTRPNHWGVKALKVISNNGGRVKFAALTDINAQDVFEIDKEHSFESGVNIKKGQTMIVNLPRKYDLKPEKVLNRVKNAYLVRYVKSEYIDKTPLLEVDMFFKAVKNEPSELTVMSEGVYATVCGNEVQQAQKQAASDTDIADKLSQTGNSIFKAGNIEVHIDKDIFMPVGELKKLRREALDKLYENITKAYRRTYTDKVPEENVVLDNTENIEHYKTVYLYNVKNISTILDCEDVRRVYIDFSLMYTDKKNCLEACKKVKTSGKELYFGLPYILTQDNHKKMQDLLQDLLSIGIDGVLVRNLEQIGMLSLMSKNSSMPKIITDAGLYIFNTYAKEELKDIAKNAKADMAMYTLPYELNSSELKSVCGADSELIVYGRVPLMVSKQCVKKTYGKCNHANDTVVLTQKAADSYEVKSVCSFCYSVTLSKIFDISEEKALSDMNIGAVRYEFDEESKEQIQAILEGESITDYKGHFYRGVN